MTKRFLSLLTLLNVIFTASYAQSEKQSIGHIGLVYPFSTNGVNAAEYSNPFSLHAIAGVSGTEQAFCASGVTNIIMHDAKGLIAAGFSNHIFNSANGAVFAGFMNTVSNDMQGIVAAGFLNVCGRADGVQMAGFANVSASETNGVQAAGFINTAADVNTQIAGFINIAKKVKGVQLSGFINIAEESDYPIGLVNIIKNGERGIGFTYDETQTAMVSLRSGSKKFYGILGIGINFKQFDPLYALECGIGGNLVRAGIFRLKLEGSVLSLTDFYENTYLRSSVRLLPSARIAERIDVFAGPSFNHIVFEDHRTPDLIEHYAWENKSWGYVNGLYVGGVAGVQIMF